MEMTLDWPAYATRERRPHARVAPAAYPERAAPRSPSYDDLAALAGVAPAADAPAPLDTVAFGEAYAAHHGPLCAFAARLVRPRAVAEDLVHDVFAALWTRRHILRDQALVTSYLYSAVRNRAVSHLRHQRVVRREMEETVAPSAPRTAPPADDQFWLLELESAAHAAVGTLPARCREIYLLQRREGLRYAEIAARLGISVKTVETQMSRALRALRERLSPYLC